MPRQWTAEEIEEIDEIINRYYEDKYGRPHVHGQLLYDDEIYLVNIHQGIILSFTKPFNGYQLHVDTDFIDKGTVKVNSFSKLLDRLEVLLDPMGPPNNIY